MKVLFIGGTGLISTACTDLAARRGIELVLLNRGKRSTNIPGGVKVIQADIRNPTETAAALKGQTFDVVVNWIAFTLPHVETDIELFRGKTNQFIFISSASAYQKPPSHPVITESTPLANPFWQYSRDKIACEERLMREYRENGFPITIVRPSFTYGPTMIPLAFSSWQHPWTVAARMLEGKPVVVPGDGTSLWVTTHNTDFAKGFVGLLGQIQSIGHAFHITSDEAMPWNQHYEVLGRVLGVEPKLVHVPSRVIERFAPGEQGGLWGDKSHSAIFDNSKIRRFVPDYVATTTLEQGFAQSVAHFRAHPELQTTDDNFNKLNDQLIAAMEGVAPKG